jgi:hypothetical protein
MEEINIKKFFKDTFNKGNFKDYFNSNKIFLSLSFIIVILSLWSGFTDYSSYSELLVYINQLTGNLILSDNNFICCIMIIVSGVTFSISSLLLTIIKSVSVGDLFATQVTNLQIISESIVLLSLILSLTGALLVTKMEVRMLSLIFNRNLGDIFKKIKVPLKDLILTAFFIIILTIISTIIEMI